MAAESVRPWARSGASAESNKHLNKYSEEVPDHVGARLVRLWRLWVRVAVGGGLGILLESTRKLISCLARNHSGHGWPMTTRIGSPKIGNIEKRKVNNIQGKPAFEL